MMEYKEIIQADKKRWGRISVFNYPQYSLVRLKRLCEKYGNCKVVYVILWLLYRRKNIKYGCDIPAQTIIGKGLKLEHQNGIVLNPGVIIGEYCTLLNGVLCGNEKRGNRMGTPTIGNKVYIGTNAIIVGNISVGNDVLIAPGAYVNFDVPDHSIVIGNPGKIILKYNATESYIEEIM